MEQFKCIFESKCIVPNAEAVRLFATRDDRWHGSLLATASSEDFKKLEGREQTITIVSSVQLVHSYQCAKFLETRNSVCGNVYALATALMLFELVLPADALLLGFDVQEKLAADPWGEAKIPYLIRRFDGRLRQYGSKGWHGMWGRGTSLVFLTD